MPTIDVNGTTLHYERTGSGPAVLFIHGLSGNADVWADQAARLSDRATCVRYDRRGHTRSRRGDGPVDVGRHADDAAGLIEALGLAPCLVVGSSLGGNVTLDLARRYPHLVRGFAVSEPPLFSIDPEGGRALLAEVMPRVDEAMAAGGPRVALDAFLSTVCPGLWSMIDEEARDGYRANAEIAFSDLAGAPLELRAEDLAQIGMPALVIAGGESHPSARSIARGIAAALPDSRFVELAGSGHVTYAERPDDFARAVGAFVAELDRQATPTSR